MSEQEKNTALIGILDVGIQDVFTGTEGNDTIDGTVNDDTIDGLGGDDTLNGNGGIDTINGGEGDDNISGGDGNDTLNGDAGDDDIDGDAGVDTINGGGGADTIDGGTGDDTIDGGAGDDGIQGGSGSDTINGGDGIDVILGGTGEDTIDGGADDDTISGGDDNDTVTGGAGNDTITGNDGDDDLKGGLGDDDIDGGVGADTIDGEDGDDIIRGGVGNDTLMGGAGIDQIFGGSDDDTIDGGAGEDEISGDSGADTIEGGDGDDTIDGGSGDDILTGGAGADSIEGGTGDDTISGGEGDDSLSGGSGNDVITSDAGNDALDGGAGDDRLVVDLTGKKVDVFDTGGGTDLLLHFGGAGTVSIHYDEDDELVAEAAIASLQTTIYIGPGIDGYSSAFDLDGDNAIFFTTGFIGDSGNNILLGGELGERLLGGDGDDHLWSFTGRDELNGGDGDDIYQFRIGDGFDTIIDSGGSDVILMPEHTLGSVQLQRVRDDLLIVYGGSIVEMDDYFEEGVGGPEAIIFKRANDESLPDSYVLNLSAAAEDLEPIGFDADPRDIDGILRIYSGSQNRFEEFSEKEDDIRGADGNDTLLGRQDDDRISGGDGVDRLIGGQGDDYLLGGEGDDFLHDLDVLDNVTEELSRREFTDERDNDEIEGGEGDDEIWTSIGNNLLKGQAGDDTYYAAARGSDEIREGGGQLNVLVQDNKTGLLADEEDSRESPTTEIFYDIDTLDLLWREAALIGFEDNPVDDEGEITNSTVITDTLFAGEFQVLITDQVEQQNPNARVELITMTDRYAEGGKQTYVFQEANEGTVDNDLFSGNFLNERDVVGGKGDDIFFMAGGRDIMRGGDGDDVFVMRSGDGFDRVADTEGFDRIVLPDETDIDDIDILRIGDDLVLGHGDDDLVEIVGYFAGKNQIELLQLGVDPGILDADDGDANAIRNALLAVEFDIDVLAATAVNSAEVRPEETDANKTGTRVDETIGGDLGDNIIDGAGGNDVLIGLTGDDMLEGGKGNDILDGGRGNDVLSGGSGDDELYGYGREADQQAVAIEDRDMLDGGDGNDLLEGGIGDDELLGGSGNDTIYGWFENESSASALLETVLVWDWPDVEGDPTNAVYVRPTLSLGDNLESDADDILGEISTISFLKYNTSYIQPDRFMKSEVLGQEFEDSNTIDAGAGDDTIILGHGNDTVIGGAGNDTYKIIQNTTFSAVEITITEGGLESDDDTLVLDSSFRFADISQDGDDLIIQTFVYTVRIVDYYDETQPGAVIEFFETESGESLNDIFFEEPEEPEEEDTLTGDDGDNTLTGSNAPNELLLGRGGDDTLDGNEGYDVLRGGDGDDTYIINVGDGSDIIVDTDGDDAIEFGFGVDLSFFRLSNDLLIRYSDTLTDLDSDGTPDDEDVLILPGYFLPGGKMIETIIVNGQESALTTETRGLQPGSDPREININRTIFGTSDGETINGTKGRDELRGLAGNDTLIGGKGRDSLYGGDGKDDLDGGKSIDYLDGGIGKDKLNGGKGDDTLEGGDGNDKLIGGRDDDSMNGGAGKDKYLFSADDGEDTIEETEGGNDIVVLDDVGPTDAIGARRQGDDLIITYSEDDSITIVGQFGVDENAMIEKLRVSSGQTYRIRGTDGDGNSKDELLVGTNGKDVIQGRNGNDLLAGGRGNDDLQGGRGDDIYSFFSGDDRDRIRDNGADNDLDIIMLSDLPTTEDIAMDIDGDDLIIWYSEDRQDEIRIIDQFADETRQIELLVINNDNVDPIDLTGDIDIFLI